MGPQSRRAGTTTSVWPRSSPGAPGFRCLKGLDLRIRPIFHRTEGHVRAHIFLCLTCRGSAAGANSGRSRKASTCPTSLDLPCFVYFFAGLFFTTTFTLSSITRAVDEI